MLRSVARDQPMRLICRGQGRPANTVVDNALLGHVFGVVQVATVKDETPVEFFFEQIEVRAACE